MIADKLFNNTFAAYFNVDTLDADNPAQLDSLAVVAAQKFVQDREACDSILRDLKLFLERWDTETKLQLIRITNVDWLADAKEEENLRSVIVRIVETMESQLG